MSFSSTKDGTLTCSVEVMMPGVTESDIFRAYLMREKCPAELVQKFDKKFLSQRDTAYANSKSKNKAKFTVTFFNELHARMAMVFTLKELETSGFIQRNIPHMPPGTLVMVNENTSGAEWIKTHHETVFSPMEEGYIAKCSITLTTTNVAVQWLVTQLAPSFFAIWTEDMRNLPELFRCILDHTKHLESI